MVYAADKFLRKFLGISSIRDPGILNNYNHEDPTYPIFHVKFAFNPPEAKHPDYVVNRLLSDLKNEESPVDPDSAVKFLYNVGEPERAMMLKKFNIGLRTISEETPWFFQSLSGIDSLYKQGYSTESQGEKGIQDVVLELRTLDSIDYRITALKDLYRKAAYDRKFRRWILPLNMRRFRMSVMIGEFRQLAITEDNYSINGRQALKALRDIDIFNASNVGGKLLGKVKDGDLSFVKRLQWWDNHFSCLVFDCQDCEFDMSTFPSGTLTHDRLGSTAQTQTIKIKVGRVLETNTYSLLEYSLSDNLIENFLKSEGQDKKNVLTRSKNLNQAFKPKVASWQSYQDLEREKGDNKRVILDDGGFSQALGGGINEGINAAADFLGVGGILGGGSNFGSAGGIAGSLGSIADFAGDTASEIAQEALGMATEQIAKNVYDNELYRSIAGVGLGVLNGDLNQVAQNFTNPALAGALGINIESSGRQVPPNLREGIPTKLDLIAPNVQKSASDIQANLTGAGADPRFTSVGRPGQSLFNNPDPTTKLFDQKNIDLQASRVETQMPKNIEFSDVRKETRINPKKEELRGANKKTKFDENSIELKSGGKKTDLTPNKEVLTGAQPLKDLIPDNADLRGAQPLKDLIPDNADLRGAQPLKDLNPDNANLRGAQPLKDLVPNNADLMGAQALKDLVPSNADLTGAGSLQKIDPYNIELDGADALKNFNQINIKLEGFEPLKSINSENNELTGAEALRSLNETKVKLEGAEPSNRTNSDNVDLKGFIPKTNLNESKIELSEAKVLRDLPSLRENLVAPSKSVSFDQTNADLSGVVPKKTFDEANANLIGSSKVTSTLRNAELTGLTPENTFSQSNIGLTGIRTRTVRDLGNEELVGKEPQTRFSNSNVGNMSQDIKSTVSTLGNENLIGSKPIKNLSETNVELIGKQPQSQSIRNIDLKSSTNNSVSDINIKLEGKKPETTMSTNIDLKGSNSNTQRISPTNVNLEKPYVATKTGSTNVNLQGSQPSKSMMKNIYEGQKNLGIIGFSKISYQGRIDFDE